jgi:hypothetical protein
MSHFDKALKALDDLNLRDEHAKLWPLGNYAERLGETISEWDHQMLTVKAAHAYRVQLEREEAAYPRDESDGPVYPDTRSVLDWLANYMHGFNRATSGHPDIRAELMPWHILEEASEIILALCIALSDAQQQQAKLRRQLSEAEMKLHWSKFPKSPDDMPSDPPDETAADQNG